MTTFNYSISKLKKLRFNTKLSILSCKKALIASNNDFDRALSFLKKTPSHTNVFTTCTEGLVGSYIHYNNKLGVLIQLNCKTDFIVKNESFLLLSKKLCLHIASTNPMYRSINSIGVSFLKRLKRNILKGFIKKNHKPLSELVKVCKFKLLDWLKKNCLIEQDFIMDNTYTVKSLIEGCSKLLGERITFTKYTIYKIVN